MKKGEATGRGNTDISFEEFKAEVLNDYRLACESRETSLLGRKEVLTGKAKFGIFGDGKEVPQIAMAKAFKDGDFRSGYYRDQTLIFATGMGTIQQFFAQLFADTDPENDTFSAGRQMNAHYATTSIDEDGNWKELSKQKNSSADTSPTASQMSRAVGLALASKYYRENPELKDYKQFSNKGNEVTFCTIGDASTSEGVFWETVNAAGVLKIPLAISLWDDGYGISVPQKYQTTKQDLSEILEGFRVNEDGEGFDIYTLYAWDYPSLCEMYKKGIEKIRETHIPAIFHIKECTQPQGHSTSGSHERYKSKERLAWEEEFDGIRKLGEWMIENAIADEKELNEIKEEARKQVNRWKKDAWKAYTAPIKQEIKEIIDLFDQLIAKAPEIASDIESIKSNLNSTLDPMRRDVRAAVRTVLRAARDQGSDVRAKLLSWKQSADEKNRERFNSHLYSESGGSAMEVDVIEPEYGDSPEEKNGFEILNACFDSAIQREPLLIAFGEDLGKIGDVNQGFAGLQEKYGEHRVFDVGIRENTIIGQGIGMAMRGLRPIAEIQYLDYLIYGLQPITDDLATLQYRTKGKQRSPLIIRTRGHRLEGIWHTGSPMSMILGSIRGIRLLVPRNMTQAAGFYNTMLRSDEPAIVIECLNGYRLKEKMPTNIGEFTVPLGIPEVIHEGDDITIVTYGSNCRIAMEAVMQLKDIGINCELIDVQTLLPFDINHSIVKSLEKTGKIIFLDEDVPGGASSYMMQKVIEEQEGFFWLDQPPKTLTAKPHRAAYASDGDYFSKPGVEDVFETVYLMMNDEDPDEYPEYL
ncbi:MAG: transketolase [Bacteroidetes bacterium]|nr:transketolase [Bacteroidota bacterium]